MSYGDAVQREVEWLTADESGIGLAPLTKALDGPFDLVKEYGRNPNARTQGRVLFVARERVTEIRFDWQHKQHIHQMRLKIGWPIRGGDPGTAFANLDDALDIVLARIRGPRGDKTHGGRFTAVAEGDDQGTAPMIQVEYDDPELTEDNDSRSDVLVRYLAADTPFPG